MIFFQEFLVATSISIGSGKRRPAALVETWGRGTADSNPAGTATMWLLFYLGRREVKGFGEWQRMG